MTSAAWIPIAAGATALALHLWGVATRRPIAYGVGKIACSAGYLALPLLLGVGTPYARTVLVALALSAVGDVLLLSKRERPFLAGLVAFLLAHVVYAIAFAGASRPSPWALLPLAAAALGVLRWLWPHLGPMRAPVAVYCVAISAMLWFALGSAATGLRVGAFLFYLSDLAVARDRFVKPEPANDLVGHPLYFAGQYLIALSVG